MPLLCAWMFTSILGTDEEMKQMSIKDKLERKKFMGVWRWASKVVARMMSKVPKHSEQVHEQEQSKEKWLHFRIL